MKYLLALFAFIVYNLPAAIGQSAPDHIVMVILENKPYQEMVGNPNLPYINSLINHPKALVMTQSYGLTRPSQPNYFMLFSGSDEGVHHNWVVPNTPFNTPNIAASLRANGFSFTGYAEDLPSVGSTDSISGHYVRKHNPWVNWQGTGTNNIPDSCNRPWSDFPKNYNLLPTVSYVVPNQANDMHSGPSHVADAWLRDSLDTYVQWCLNNNSLFILTFDEDNNSGLFNNQILTLFIGANTGGGFYNNQVTHYNVLRTLEQLYQIPYSGKSADSTAIANVWLTLLPLATTQFKGFADGNKIQLSWQKNSSTAIKYFELQRSTDGGRTFETIAKKTADQVRYTYTDYSPANGLNLYRLKEVLADNNSRYSTVISVTTKSDFDKIFSISPNPFRDAITIHYKLQGSANIALEVLDAAGNTVRKQLLQIASSQPLKVSLATLPAGVYYLRLHTGNKTIVKKIQKV